MLKKISRLTLIASLILSINTGLTASPSINPQEQCVLLGTKPSLIIKFKNNPSSYDLNNVLSSSFLTSLSTPTVQFTESSVMSGGAFIVYFKTIPSTKHQDEELVQIKPNCYSKESIFKLISKLKQRPDIEYIDPNSRGTLRQTKPSNTPVPTKIQWNLLTPPVPTAGPAGVNVAGAWPITLGNPNVATAVLDDGILNNDSLNPNLLPGAHFLDDNTNNGAGATPSCDTNNDHGTHVAGTVASTGNGAYGRKIFGVAPTSKVVPINVFSKVDSDTKNECKTTFFVSDITNALNWLAGKTVQGAPPLPKGVMAVNMSLGDAIVPCPNSAQQAINNVVAKNIAIAVAAGNDDAEATGWPETCLNVIPVAATDPTGFRASYSSFGSVVKIAAPGGDSDVVFPEDPRIISTIENNYGYQEGTSMASPHVAGVIALLKSVNPALTPAQILTLIQETATRFAISADAQKNCLPQPVPPSKPCGAGIVNAGAAIQRAAQSIAPVLTTAIRNPMDKTQAFVFYERLGSFQPGITTFSVNGSPNATATLDVARQRIVVSNIVSPRAVTITITIKNGSIQVTSNSVIIPGILG